MKRLILVISIVLFAISAYAQAPQKFNYQAIARNPSGAELPNQAIGVRLSILDGSPGGTVVYQETHSLTTNVFGLFNLKVGDGTVISGNFSSIAWGSGSKYIRTEIDPAGGTNYSVAGVSELISVPYALYANNSPAGPTGPQGPTGLPGVNGSNGPTGPQGIQGIQGPTGANGTNGTNGATGATGPQGLQGPIGPTGANGADGATGPQGPTGANGTNGADGATGPQGPTGANGADGATGPQGLQGPIGPTGANGADGATGPQGLQGPTGANGADGATGPQGPTGANGVDGATGPQGLQGPIGPTGANGADGATGPQGPQGPTGANGADGATGPQGPTGANGTNGADGATGPQGPTGANGVDGATGPQGLQGPAGADGNDGADGATGPQGPQGLQGPAGANGADGATGPQGPIGPAGADGADGLDGATGPQGPIGPTGANGADGATGPQGPTGANGTNGADGATGATGATGPQGPIGPTGANGTNGTNGADGATGATGPQGPTGANGTNGADGATGPIGPTGANGTNGTNGADGATGATGPQGLQGPIGPTGANGTNGTNGADGATGATGPQGPIGPTGANGTNGTNGADGATGATGPQGPIGPTGANGTNGTNGADGATGATGPQGPIGPTGANGTNGTNGADGATGATGPQGPIGPTGANGADGATGPQGPTGATGVGAPVSTLALRGNIQSLAAGFNNIEFPNTVTENTFGTSGITYIGGGVFTNNTSSPIIINVSLYVQAIGSILLDNVRILKNGQAQIVTKTEGVNNQGHFDVNMVVQPSDIITIPTFALSSGNLDFSTTYIVIAELTGAIGADGATGPQGPTGANGADGAIGPQGPTGANGADGATGPQGPQGLQGPQGPAGANGIDGATGATGPTGAANANGTVNYVAKFTPDGQSLGDSQIFDDGNSIGIGTATPFFSVHVVKPGDNLIGIEGQSSNGFSGVGFLNDIFSYAEIGINGSNHPALPNALVFNNTANAPIRIMTNSQDRMRILGSGEIGIGTTSPTATLHVDGTFRLEDGTQAAGYILTSDANGNASWQPAGSVSGAWLTTGNAGTDASTNFIGTTDSVDFVVRTNNNEVARYFTNGNVGIGTTNPFLAKLSVVDTNAFSTTGYFQGGLINTFVLQNNQDPNGSYSAFFFQNDSTGLDAVIGRASFPGIVPKTLVFDAGVDQNPNFEMVITPDSGFVGINNEQPQAKLDVNGSFRYTDGNEAVGFVLKSDANGFASWQPDTVAAVSNGWLTTGNASTNDSLNFIGTLDAEDLVIRTNNTEAARVGVNSNFGVGTNVAPATSQMEVFYRNKNNDYTFRATSDTSATLSNNRPTIGSFEYTGPQLDPDTSSNLYDVIAVEGRSYVADYWGYGGRFTGGYYGIDIDVPGIGDNSYYGIGVDVTGGDDADITGIEVFTNGGTSGGAVGLDLSMFVADNQDRQKGIDFDISNGNQIYGLDGDINADSSEVWGFYNDIDGNNSVFTGIYNNIDLFDSSPSNSITGIDNDLTAQDTAFVRSSLTFVGIGNSGTSRFHDANVSANDNNTLFGNNFTFSAASGNSISANEVTINTSGNNNTVYGGLSNISVSAGKFNTTYGNYKLINSGDSSSTTGDFNFLFSNFNSTVQTGVLSVILGSGVNEGNAAGVFINTNGPVSTYNVLSIPSIDTQFNPSFTDAAAGSFNSVGGGTVPNTYGSFNQSSGGTSLSIGSGNYAFNSGSSVSNYGTYGVADEAPGAPLVTVGVFGEYNGTNSSLVNAAGYFQGDVDVVGDLSKGSGTFKIDHPLDPENKYLYHSFVESPDMMNVYNGNITTDAAGFATVTMPDYFSTLNKDFRYQLTTIGTFAQAIVAKELEGNTFVIQTDKPNVKVSWQITGVRQDPYANMKRVVPEVEKPEPFKGTYLYPEAYGQPKSKSEGALISPRRDTPSTGKNAIDRIMDNTKKATANVPNAADVEANRKVEMANRKAKADKLEAESIADDARKVADKKAKEEANKKANPTQQGNTAKPATTRPATTAPVTKPAVAPAGKPATAPAQKTVPKATQPAQSPWKQAGRK